jgi:hypothetical protein
MPKAQGLLLALGLPKGKMMRERESEKEPVEDDGEDYAETESTPDQLEAAQGLIDAVKAKDAEGVVMAYKALKYCCEEEDEEEPPSSKPGKY